MLATGWADSTCSYNDIERRWPWLISGAEDQTGHISLLFGKVCRGDMTFERLVDYVRCIEPECGECNRFECSCVKPSVEQSVSGVELKEKVSK